MDENPFSEPVRVPIEDSIDLHTFVPKEIRIVIEEYVREAHRAGFREVRIIHGRGEGVQREIVRSLLAKHPLVLQFRDASLPEGGLGATLVRLRPVEDRIP